MDSHLDAAGAAQRPRLRRQQRRLRGRHLQLDAGGVAGYGLLGAPRLAQRVAQVVVGWGGVWDGWVGWVGWAGAEKCAAGARRRLAGQANRTAQAYIMPSVHAAARAGSFSPSGNCGCAAMARR